MPDTVFLKIDVTKIPKEWLFKGAKGTYADIAVYENEQPDEYGNTHAVKMNPPKAVKERDPNVKGVYIGNGKRLERRDGGSQSQARPAPGSQQRSQGGQRSQQQSRQPQQSQTMDEVFGGGDDSEEIPF
jgi:hypothetical protein